MATVTIKSGSFSQGKHLFADASNPRPPFVKPSNIVCTRLKVGTDFTSGDTVIVSLQATKDVIFADIKTPTGTAVAYNIGDITPSAGVSGKTVTVTNATTDLLIFIVTTV